MRPDPLSEAAARRHRPDALLLPGLAGTSAAGVYAAALATGGWERDAEREIIFNEFKNRKEEIVSGIVTRFERKNLIVQLRPNVDAILPEKEQIPRERYRPQDRIRPYVLDVDMPVLGGPGMAHKMLLHDAGEQNIPILLMSAREDLAQVAGRMGKEIE